MPGTLFLVATPIGNLEDVTARAIRILGEVDLVAAEDTRRTGRLLQHIGVTNALRSYYDAVERERAPALVRELLAGKSVALVSDAGTPGIADPGYRLVAEASAAGATEDIEEEIRRRRAAGESVRDLSDAIALARGVSRRTVYRLALELERTPR